jgi:magnesium transporter
VRCSAFTRSHLEDSKQFGQRPKLDSFVDYVFLVFYGAWRHGREDREPLREVHLFISGQYLVTIHRDPLRPLEQQREQLQGRVLHSEQFLLYRVFDALTDSFFPLLSDMDSEIDELESAMLVNPTDRQLERLFSLKRQLVAMRKVVTPQRDLFARSVDQIAELPGLELDERDYFRDVYDHLIRISDLIDTYRDLLSGATDLYLSTVSNRQNDVMKQLTVIATIFLPLSLITGFCGQNFGYLVTDLIRARGPSGSWASAACSRPASACCGTSTAKAGSDRDGTEPCRRSTLHRHKSADRRCHQGSPQAWFLARRRAAVGRRDSDAYREPDDLGEEQGGGEHEFGRGGRWVRAGSVSRGPVGRGSGVVA